MVNRGFKLGELLTYSEEDSNIFDSSEEAVALGLGNISMLDIMNVKAQLEMIVWKKFAKDMIDSCALSWLEAKIDDKKKSDIILQANTNAVLAHLKEDQPMFLPYAGSVSIVPSKDSVKLANIFGVDYYIQKNGYEAQTQCPAWAAKAVTRDDHAFFQLQKQSLDLYLISWSEIEILPSDEQEATAEKPKVDASVESADDDAFDEADEAAGGKTTFGECHDLHLSLTPPAKVQPPGIRCSSVSVKLEWHGISPITNLDSKLKKLTDAKAELAKRRQIKAEKKRATLEKKLSTLNKKGVPNESEISKVKKQLEKLTGDDEESDECIEYEKAIPITRMQTPAEFESKSARAKALQEAIAATESSALATSYGLSGFKKHLQDEGKLVVKAKKKANDKNVQDVMKMGTHLLK